MEQANTIEPDKLPVASMNLAMLFNIPAVRQIGLLIGVAGAVAIGFAVVLWSQTPGQSRLYEGLDNEDLGQVADILRGANIDFKLNMDTGTVTVPESKLHDARLELASQGLPRGAAVGMRSLQEQPAFGQSQFRENALYQHALEAELARTVTHLGAVRDARVHLALPRQSAFVRDRKPASASVMLSLYRGRELEDGQVASIVHLVASSVPNLAPENVTVIDQQGRLLSSGDERWDGALTAKHYQLAARIEQDYRRRIEALLTPLLGPGRVRAEVVADMDFTVSEEMRESFDPNGVVISEHVSENRRNSGGQDAVGVPGALSNQPPAAGGVEPAAADAVVNASSTSTRNYEVDRTISRTRPQAGTIRRLSVAVLVDDVGAAAGVEGGDAEGGGAAALSEEDIERFTALVREAVGFNAARGDSVVVVKAAFQAVPEAESAASAGFWAKPAFMDVMKQLLGACLVLALAFGLVRPLLKSLLANNEASAARAMLGNVNGAAPATVGQLPGNTASLPSFDEKVAAARKISGHDPAKVAQVVRQWVDASGQ